MMTLRDVIAWYQSPYAEFHQIYSIPPHLDVLNLKATVEVKVKLEHGMAGVVVESKLVVYDTLLEAEVTEIDLVLKITRDAIQTNHPRAHHLTVARIAVYLSIFIVLD